MKKFVLIKRTVLVLMLVSILLLVSCSFRGCGKDNESGDDQNPPIDTPTNIVNFEFALNSDGESYYVKGVDNITVTEITIPETYEGKPVTGIGVGAFKNFVALIKVTLPNTITYIADEAFYGCTSLIEINIPDGVERIGKYFH